MKVAFQEIGIEKGDVIHGIYCEHVFLVDDLLIIKDQGNCHAFYAENFKQEAKAYEVDGQKIERVFLPKNVEVIILESAEQVLFRDFKNQTLDPKGLWADYFIEPFSGDFYRMDKIICPESFWI